jgi:cyanuric acid amidohydrolase
MNRVADIFVAPAAGAHDVTALIDALTTGLFRADEVVGVIAQTEGWIEARALGLLQFSRALAPALGMEVDAVTEHVPLMMIGMCGGVMSPHYAVWLNRESDATPSGEPRLVIGAADTEQHAPEDLGTAAHARAVAEATERAVADAGLSPADVACVEVKCPSMTPTRLADAETRGVSLRTTDIATASARSRGSAALGVAIALGEVAAAAVTDDAICADWSLHSNVASVSAGGEQTRTRIVVMGNSTASASTLRIGSGVMSDTLDLRGVVSALEDSGLVDVGVPLSQEQAARVAHVFVNCGANAVGSTRGRRHTMNSDYLAQHAGSFAKAVGNAVVASVIGDPMILASAGPEHQGAPGSNLVAVLTRHDR